MKCNHEHMIRADSLRIDYENVTAVYDVDLHARAGEIYGLVGPNGAGKTSTIKALAGLLEPTYGVVKLADIDLDLNPEEAWKHLGYMPDFPPVYENLKVWEYLDIFAAAHLIPSDGRLDRARKWVERLSLEGKWDAFVRDLSRGMRQRLVFARTLLHEPSILLLDEPASGMDPMGRIDLRAILKETADGGAAVLISSHILTELSDFCTSVGIMEKGRIVAGGTIDEIRTQIGSLGRLSVRLSTVTEASRAALQQTLEGSGLVRDLRQESEGVFEGKFTGGDTDAGQLLAKIVAEQIPVADFHVQKENIEDIFLAIGAREVS